MALVVSMVVGSTFAVGGSGDRAEFWVVAVLTNGLHKNELKLLFSN